MYNYKIFPFFSLCVLDSCSPVEVDRVNGCGTLVHVCPSSYLKSLKQKMSVLSRGFSTCKSTSKPVSYRDI